MNKNATHPETALVPAVSTSIAIPTAAELQRTDPARYELLVKQVANGLSPLQVEFFIARCNALQLDPFAGDIYAWISQGKVVIHPSLGGLIKIAHRDGLFDGFEGPYWTADGVTWSEIWVDPTKPPAGAKCYVYRKGCSRPFPGVRSYEETVKRNGASPTGQWATMPAHMLGVRALYSALKLALPAMMGLDLDMENGTVVEEATYHSPSSHAPQLSAPPAPMAAQQPLKAAGLRVAKPTRADMVARCEDWFERLSVTRGNIAVEEWNRRFPNARDYGSLTEEELVSWGRILKKMVEEPEYDPRPITQPSQAQALAETEREGKDSPACENCGASMTAAQTSLSRRKFRHAYCPACQKELKSAGAHEPASAPAEPAESMPAEPTSAQVVQPGVCENCGQPAPEGEFCCSRCDPYSPDFDEDYCKTRGGKEAAP